MAAPVSAFRPVASTDDAPRLPRVLPSASGVFAIAGTLILFALTKALSTLVPELEDSPGLYVAGGMAILALPALMAVNRHAFHVLGAEVLPAVAFYLSMYHAPLRRLLFGGRPFAPTELHVLDVSLYAALVVSALVCLRPNAFNKARLSLSPVPDLTPHVARIYAITGVILTIVGYTLLTFWIGSVGIDRLATASLGDVYVYASGNAAVTFQWPFIVGGIVTMGGAFARWPEPGPTRTLLAFHVAAIAVYVFVNARLGVRGPTLELFVATYLVRRQTRRPIGRRAFTILGAAFLLFFFTVSAARSHLDTGITGTSADEVAFQVKDSFSTEAVTEFDAIFENHAMMVELAGTKIPFLEGESWTDIPLQLIPRQIVGSKPLGLSAWWIQAIDPETARQGGGRAFGSFAEGYLNFGVAGAILQVAAVTIFLLGIFPILRALSCGVAANAAIMLAHGYYCHRSEFIAVVFFARNAVLVAMAALLVRALVAMLLRPIKLPR